MLKPSEETCTGIQTNVLSSGHRVTTQNKIHQLLLKATISIFESILHIMVASHTLARHATQPVQNIFFIFGD